MLKHSETCAITGNEASPYRFLASAPGSSSNLCHIEKWTADLSTGVFDLGPVSRYNHGLDCRCDLGLLDIVRPYDAHSRRYVLELFELAATQASSFCFSPGFASDFKKASASFMCIGESTDISDGGGTLGGVFVFARFMADKTFAPRGLVARDEFAPSAA